MEYTSATAANPHLGEPGLLVTPNTQERLSFRIGSEEYCIDILKVKEIRGYETSTRMVGAPEYVKGVLNLRGIIVPIIDLRIKFGLPDVQYTALTVTVILNLVHGEVGIVVDRVSDVVELAPEQIRPVPEFDGYVDSGSVTGIGTVHQNGQERMLILLDVERLMASAGTAARAPTLQ